MEGREHRFDKRSGAKPEVPLHGEGATEADWSSLTPEALIRRALDYNPNEEVEKHSRLPHRLTEVLKEVAEQQEALNEEMGLLEREVFDFMKDAVEKSAHDIIADTTKGKEVVVELLRAASDVMWRLQVGMWREIAEQTLNTTIAEAADASDQAAADAEEVEGDDDTFETERDRLARQLFMQHFAKEIGPGVRNALLEKLEELREQH